MHTLTPLITPQVFAKHFKSARSHGTTTKKASAARTREMECARARNSSSGSAAAAAAPDSEREGDGGTHSILEEAIQAYCGPEGVGDTTCPCVDEPVMMTPPQAPV